MAGETTTFAWITGLAVDTHSVADIATKGGRHRWHIENQGFNRQKNSGFNLEHVFSIDPENLKAYYFYCIGLDFGATYSCVIAYVLYQF